MRMAAAECYEAYVALVAHFKGAGYDFFKYGGKIRHGDFSKHKNRYQFQKLSRKYDGTEIVTFLAANLAYRNEQVWIGELLNNESHDIYLNHVKYRDSFKYMFERDLDLLFQNESYKDIIKCKDGEWPTLANRLYSNEIALETFCIMNKYLEFLGSFDKNIDDDILWPKVSLKVTKFTPFIKYDGKIAKRILLDKVKMSLT